MPPEATLPRSDVNVPGDYFSLAGFEVTTYGRFWVSPEDVIETYLVYQMQMKWTMKRPESEPEKGAVVSQKSVAALITMTIR